MARALAACSESEGPRQINRGAGRLPWRLMTATLALACLGLAAPTWPDDGGLQAAIAQVREGDFENAIVSLEVVIQELMPRAEARPVALAYFYLGVAHLGLNQDQVAQSKMIQGLAIDPSLRPDPSQHSRRVLRAFEEARRVAAERMRPQNQARRGRGKLPLIIGGGAAVAAGALLATPASGRSSAAPSTPVIRISPADPVPLLGTPIAFSAETTDPEGDPLAFDWDFGNGARAAGASVVYTYQTQPPYYGRTAYKVTVRVTDGTNSVAAQTDVNLTQPGGLWRVNGFGGLATIQITSWESYTGTGAGSAAFSDGTSRPLRLQVTQPRHLALSTTAGPAGLIQFEGDLNGDGNVFQGQMQCTTDCQDLARQYQLPYPGPVTLQLVRIGSASDR